MKSIVLSVGIFLVSTVAFAESTRVCGLFQDVGFGPGIRSANGVAYEMNVANDEAGQILDNINRLAESRVNIVGCVEGEVNQQTNEGAKSISVSTFEVVGSETITQIVRVCGVLVAKDKDRILRTSNSAFELRGWEGKEKSVDSLKNSEELFVCAKGKDWQGGVLTFIVASIQVLK